MYKREEICTRAQQYLSLSLSFYLVSVCDVIIIIIMRGLTTAIRRQFITFGIALYNRANGLTAVE